MCLLNCIINILPLSVASLEDNYIVVWNMLWFVFENFSVFIA